MTFSTRFRPLCFFRPVCDQKVVEKNNKNCFWSVQGGAVHLRMFSYAQWSIKNHGRWISDFYWLLRGISREFTFRPFNLSTDVHTNGLLRASFVVIFPRVKMIVCTITTKNLGEVHQTTTPGWQHISARTTPTRRPHLYPCCRAGSSSFSGR